MKILVKCRGFIGDILFASSIAKKLKEMYQGCHVTYQIPLVQPRLLLKQNPYIDEVVLGQVSGHYDRIIDVPEVDQRYPATIWMQAHAGIEDQSTEFDVYTVPEYDVIAKSHINSLKLKAPDKKYVVAWQTNWVEKSFLFTKEEYERAIDVPNLGYGGKRRDIEFIIQELSKHFIMIPVGLPPEISQHHPLARDEVKYAKTASLIKHCDVMIGSEGGLTNLACAVGTRCIITTDFIAQLYGPKGVMKKIEHPQMGPAVYYPNDNHVHLSPFLTDHQVCLEITKHILNGEV